MNDRLKKILLKPKWVKQCSQTLCESLSFCNNMYLLTNDDAWIRECLRIIERIRKAQQNDGGFDIGYEFYFGKDHKKGWSSAPECKMLVALLDYGSVLGFEDVIDIIEKGIRWIVDNSIRISSDKWMIPYCPRASREIIIYNGISFALAPLAMYYRHIIQDDRIRDIHDGFINLLHDEFDWKSGHWRYFDQKKTDLTALQRIKVDNYHLGQQLEMHCCSSRHLPNVKNREIIDALSLFLITLHRKERPDPIPYFNYISNKRQGVHLWGYVSLIGGFLSYYEISRKKAFLIAAKQISDWINQHAWLDTHFSCIYHYRNVEPDMKFYPRSDSWVINNLSKYLKYETDGMIFERLGKVYSEIARQDFSGFENHADTMMKKLLRFLLTHKQTLYV